MCVQDLVFYFQEAKRQDANMKAKEEYTAKVEKMKKSSDVLRYQDIPWPCEGTVQDMVDVMLADAKEGFQTYFHCPLK